MILIIGDVHAEFGVINKQIRFVEKEYNTKIDAVIQLGDFGIHREPLMNFFHKQKQKFLRPVYYIDGNHEDFWNWH